MPLLASRPASGGAQALVIADKPATFERLQSRCGKFLEDAVHVGILDQKLLAWAFGALAADSPILIVTRDSLLVMNKGDDRTGCPMCVTLGRMSHGSDVETAAFRAGVICDSAPPEMLTEHVLATVPLLVEMVRKRGNAAGPHPAMKRRAFSIDFITGHIAPFETISDPTCKVCCEMRPAPAPFTVSPVSKDEPRSLRHAKLAALQIPVDTLVNSVCGPLGRGIYQARSGAYCTSARGEFREASVRRSGPIGWFGLVPRPGDCVIAGLLEGLERRAGLGHIAHGQVAAFTQLGDEAVDPRALGVYEDATYAADPMLTPFDPDREFSWVEGWSVRGGARRLIAHEYCFYGRPGIINGNSSGCATGSAPEEALLHGLLELIERDAFVVNWMAHLSPPRIANGSIPDLATRAMIARIEEAGGQLVLLDARLDLQVPVVIAVIIDRRSPFGGFSVASGASLLPEEAVRKAIFEVAVHFESFAIRAEAAAKGPFGRALEDLRLVKGLDDHPTLYGLPGAIALADFLVSSEIERGFAETFEQWEAGGAVSDTVDGDLLRVVGLLEQAGYAETIAVEQTTEQQRRLGLSTMRAIVPGLVPIDFGYGKFRAATLPRMRDLPHRLGLRSAPLEPADLYRIPHPYP